jgi:hypothetical protein
MCMGTRCFRINKYLCIHFYHIFLYIAILNELYNICSYLWNSGHFHPVLFQRRPFPCFSIWKILHIVTFAIPYLQDTIKQLHVKYKVAVSPRLLDRPRLIPSEILQIAGRG